MQKLLAPPFGPWNVLYHLNTTRAVAPASAVDYARLFFLPLVPLWGQAYLILGPDAPRTQPARAALAALGIALTLNAWFSYRFPNLGLQALNCCVTIVQMHLSLKLVEFAFLPRICDPYMRLGRSRAVAATDLCINSRMVSLGSVGLDTLAGPRNSALPPRPAIERHLEHQKRKRRPNPRPKTRAGALFRHLRHFLAHVFVLDLILAVLRRVGGDTIAAPGGMPDALATFIRRTGFVAFPGSRFQFRVPQGFILFCTEASLPIGIWMGLSLGYHLMAFLCLASGLWEVHSWDVDLFDAPWRADSLLDLWGKRWHQVFRFITLSAAVLRVLGLPVKSFYLFPLTFLFSGAMHAFGELNMVPLPRPVDIASIFLLMGAGCSAELAFKRLSGRRVKGLAGRVWTWVFMFAIGRIAVDAWLDAGVGASMLLPPGGPGEVVGPWLMTWLFAPVRLDGAATPS